MTTTYDTYASRDDVEAVFGITNVAKWGDLDNDEDATKIENRITRALEYANAVIDSRLVGGDYIIPLVPNGSDAMDPIVVNLAANIAGMWLYGARGADDVDDNGKPNNRYKGNKLNIDHTLEALVIGSMWVNCEFDE